MWINPQRIQFLIRIFYGPSSTFRIYRIMCPVPMKCKKTTNAQNLTTHYSQNVTWDHRVIPFLALTKTSLCCPVPKWNFSWPLYSNKILSFDSICGVLSVSPLLSSVTPNLVYTLDTYYLCPLFIYPLIQGKKMIEYQTPTPP